MVGVGYTIENDPTYHQGFDAGLKHARYQLESELRRIHKEMKKEGLVMAKKIKQIKLPYDEFTTVTTATNHNCNCEFCKLKD